jgi:hypothetical protein
MHGLVLGGGSDVFMQGQVGQERFDHRFVGEEVLARPPAVETDESCNPRPRGALGVHGGVVQTEHFSDFIEEFWWLTSGHVRHTRFPSWRPEIADNRHRAKLPENPTIITLSGQKCQLINGSAPSAELIHLEIHRVVGLAYIHRAAHNVEREVQLAFWGSLIRGPRE